VLRSARALAFSLRRGQRIGAEAVVVHAGSAVRDQLRGAALSQVREHLPSLLDEADSLGTDAPRLLIEPTAGGGAALAAGIASIADYLDAVADERVGLCIDTCHLHAAGHDLSSAAAMRRTLTELVAAVGAGRIGLLHVNDSRDPAGSLRDRHAAIGEGTIGAAAFGGLFTTPALRGVPMVVETEPAAQADDVSLLKKLRDKRR
jgi:deoxyribonuclease IV